MNIQANDKLPPVHAAPCRLASAVAACVLAGSFSPNISMAASATLEEVMVVARKRAESLQDAPLAVTTFSQKDLDERGMTDISMVSQSAPNVTFNATTLNNGSSNSAVIFIRGVGQSDLYPHIDPGVGIYLDGVYISRTTGGVLDVVDLQQVEILRGPQGTLFGKNTIGGAINVTTRKPGEEFSGDAKVTIGTDDRRDFSANLDIPLSDTILSRWSFSTQQRDGYVESLFDGSEFGDIDSISGRGFVTWSINEDVGLELSADYTRKREASSGPTLLAANPGTSAADGAAGFVHNNGIATLLPGGAAGANLYNEQWITGDPHKNYSNEPESFSDLDLWGAAATVTWSINDSLSFKSITALREADNDINYDSDATPHEILHPATLIEQEQFTQEFQLNGSTERLDWVAGAFYIKEDIYFDAPVSISFVATNNVSDIENTGVAAFAHATYQLTDKLNITGGIRWTEDEKGNDTDVSTANNVALAAGIAPGSLDGLPVPEGISLVVDDAKATFDEVTTTATLDYHLTEDLLVYASFSEGFKSGGYSQRIVYPRAESPSFEPEVVTSYEAGFKLTALDNRLRLNGAYFSSDYEDMQVVVFNQIEPINENAGEAEIDGFELELDAVPLPGLEVSASLGYIDAGYVQVDPGTLIDPGNELAFTPELTASLSLGYTVEGDFGKITARGDWSYRDDAYLDALNSPELLQKAYTVFNAALVYSTPEERWQVTLGGQNLTDKDYLIAGFSDLTTSSYAIGNYARPRSWSLSLKYNL